MFYLTYQKYWYILHSSDYHIEEVCYEYETDSIFSLRGNDAFIYLACLVL